MPSSGQHHHARTRLFHQHSAPFFDRPALRFSTGVYNPHRERRPDRRGAIVAPSLRVSRLSLWRFHLV